MGATAAPTLVGSSKGATSRMLVQGAAVKKVMTTLPGPASYDTGGSVLTPSTDAGFGSDLIGVLILNPKVPGQDRIYSWDGSVTAPKLLCHVFTTGAEVTAATVLSGDTLRVEFTYSK